MLLKSNTPTVHKRSAWLIIKQMLWLRLWVKVVIVQIKMAVSKTSNEDKKEVTMTLMIYSIID